MVGSAKSNEAVFFFTGLCDFYQLQHQTLAQFRTAEVHGRQDDAPGGLDAVKPSCFWPMQATAQHHARAPCLHRLSSLHIPDPCSEDPCFLRDGAVVLGPEVLRPW